MTDFSYRLAVLTHGGNDDLLAATLTAFFKHATPAPADGYLLADGGGIPEVDWPFGSGMTDEPVGFCAATRALWAKAAEPGVSHVFYLEHDFLLTRDVNLADLGSILNTYSNVPEGDYPELAQMALMRNAVSEVEKAAGGLFESRRGEYTPRWDFASPQDAWPVTWLKHRSYLTTNPSLMRRDFMADHPWPPYEDQCEGKFGLDLIQAGYSFGVWGSGEPWCQHVGERSGSGY